MKKNEEYDVKIIDQGFEGEGIAKINDMTVFINGAIKGELVKIVITKVLSNFAYGKLISVLNPSDYRGQPDCDVFTKCGGCSLRHMQYKSTLELKTEIVKNCINKALGDNINIEQCIGMEKPIGYRNKLIYPVGKDSKGNTIMGVYAKRTHKIVEPKRCFLQDEKNEIIAKELFEIIQRYNIEPYDEETGKGIIRHIMIRCGKKSKEIMIILVVNQEELPYQDEIVCEITSKYDCIKSIVKNVNEKNTNVILGEKNITIYGCNYITDSLGNFIFRISPQSFYQVNPIQTEILYEKAIKMAELTGCETVFDLYCGIGTIGIFAANNAKKVFGIEVIPEAIENAKENAKVNSISNCNFTAGEVEKILPNLVKKESADVVFIDPPRKGCDRKTLETLLQVEPKKIVYISCNPATLARDLTILQEKYEIKLVQPVDMFPYTSHVECVCSLIINESGKF